MVLLPCAGIPPRRRRSIVSLSTGEVQLCFARRKPARSGFGAPSRPLRAGLWLRDVGLRGLPAIRVDFLGLFVDHGARDDYVLASLPVHRRRDPVLGSQLE